ncbi:PEP-CTERM sorting domain-containing protein [Novosphingobium sp. YJ-S2-02]|uniref:PEP-CTERM sorting domain-containing protein n=1 Tax=Novosphingobium aureum TaxID=2792964 RepID=A0A931MLI7_9SPHN|nr:PEP-CTERM sorting domain-containing protein [Novosphingobium aureum]MBH0113111.1 PEP-CTERM sorting domain-containing protein [Novosphingobium aureum]
MLRKSITALTLTLGLTMAVATPAHATWGSWFHKHKCGCGDSTGTSMCGSSTSGGTTSSSGGTTSTSGGTTTTSGGSTTTTSGGTTQTGSSGGTAVPEPGMLGMMGLGLVGLAYARRRKKRA